MGGGIDIGGGKKSLKYLQQTAKTYMATGDPSCFSSI